MEPVKMCYLNVVFAILLVFLVKWSHSSTYGNEFDGINTELDLVKKIVNKNCLSDDPITKEMISNAQKGILSEDRHFKCYMKCYFSVYLLVEDGNILRDSLIEYFTDDHDELIRKVVKSCLPESEPHGKRDGCETVFNFLKCSIKVDPRSVVFLPF